MPKDAEQTDPIGQYIEWAEHRYDPGHYLGGNAPPHLRKHALGPHARRKAGVLIGVSGVALLPGALALSAAPSVDTFIAVALGLLFLLTATAAWKMYRA